MDAGPRPIREDTGTSGEARVWSEHVIPAL